MKLSEWLRTRSLQEVLMAAAILLLLVMIATRWRYIGSTASEAFRRRFVPPTEAVSPAVAPADSLPCDSLPDHPVR